MDIITRQRATRRNLKRYFSGVPCRSGHVSERWTKNCICVQCQRQQMKNRYETDRDKIASAKRQRLYGLTADQFMHMLEKQQHKCAICQRAETRKHKNGNVLPLSVDHDHDTGKIRGLLCKKCNTAISYLSDSYVVTERAMRYLKRHQI